MLIHKKFLAAQKLLFRRLRSVALLALHYLELKVAKTDQQTKILKQKWQNNILILKFEFDSCQI